jgi:hypothetical protein
MITMKENMCGSVNTRCLQSIASKCSVYQTNFNFFDQTKILSTSCSRHAHVLLKKPIPGIPIDVVAVNYTVFAISIFIDYYL